jgi:hypothetical protein
MEISSAAPRARRREEGRELALRYVLTDGEWDHGRLTWAADARAAGQVEALVFGNYVWEKLKMEALLRPPASCPRNLSPLRPGTLLPGRARAVSCLTETSALGVLALVSDRCHRTHLSLFSGRCR